MTCLTNDSLKKENESHRSLSSTSRTVIYNTLYDALFEIILFHLMRFLFFFYRFKAVICTIPHVYIKQYLNQFVNTLQYGSTCI